MIKKRERIVKKSFLKIEARIRERADSFYGDFKGFRKVGAYSLIMQKNGSLTLRNLVEVEGDEGRLVVKPGVGMDIVFECKFPNIIDLEINWDSVNYFVKYHSHPYLNLPNPEDISIGIGTFSSIPKNVRYLESIYSKIWTPNFLWLEYSKE